MDPTYRTGNPTGSWSTGTAVPYPGSEIWDKWPWIWDPEWGTETSMIRLSIVNCGSGIGDLGSWTADSSLRAGTIKKNRCTGVAACGRGSRIWALGFWIVDPGYRTGIQ